MTVYFDSKTGNVKRFIERLKLLLPHCIFVNINDQEFFEQAGHLITYTWAQGKVPVTTQYFVTRFSHLILSVSSSGNRNWGQSFGMAADSISKEIDCPVLHKFELSGLNEDLNIIKSFLIETERKCKNKGYKPTL